MWTKDNIYEELKQISPVLAGIPNVNVYRVSDSYFDTLPASIFNKINSADEEFSFNEGRKASYSVPEGYFEGLAGSILSKIRNADAAAAQEDELMAIAPVLAGIHKVNVYKVPVGYFETFEVKAAAPQAKVVSFRSFRKVYTYAVAAVVFAIMAISAYLYFGKDDNYSAPAIQNVAAAVSNLSEDEIENYLINESVAEISAPAIIIPDADFDVRSIIKDLSEEELKQFLQQDLAPANSNKQNS